jgi:hypothetical protein
LAPSQNVKGGGQHALDEEPHAARLNRQIGVIMPPTSIAPRADGLSLAAARRQARSSEAACVFHPLAHKRVFSLSILDYSGVEAARSWTQPYRTQFLDEFRLDPFVKTFKPERVRRKKETVSLSSGLAIEKISVNIALLAI